MKIAIVGAGWVGCHLANALKDTHEVSLFAPKGEVFGGTSIYNQNRLHLGYHYARSNLTRELCLNTFDKFLTEYGHLTKAVENNIYAIPVDNSLMDMSTYLKIFNHMNHDLVNVPGLRNIEGCIRVCERYIDPINSKNYFQKKLNSIIFNFTFLSKDFILAAKNYDLFLNCTNNFLNPNFSETYWELCLMLVYSKKRPCHFGALTLVDGPLFSIYPYIEDTVTLSHVLYTPVVRSDSPEWGSVNIDVDKHKELMEKDVLKYLPDFYNLFEYKDYFTSTKVKRKNKCDDRSPVIKIEKNIINCYTGKIQGIFYIQKFIEDKLFNL